MSKDSKLDPESQLRDALAQVRLAQRQAQEASDELRKANGRIDELMEEVAAAYLQTSDARSERDKQADRDAIRIAELEKQIGELRAEKEALQDELKTSGLNLYDQHSIAAALDKRWKSLKAALDAQAAQNAQAKVILDRDGGYIAFEQKCREKIEKLEKDVFDAEAKATVDRKELADWLSNAEAKAHEQIAELERTRKATEQKHERRMIIADREFESHKDKLAGDLAQKREYVEQEKAALDAQEKTVREECNQRMSALQHRVELAERQQQQKWELEAMRFENRVKSMKKEADEAAERYQARIRGQNEQLQKQVRESEMVLNTRRNTISKHDSVAKTYGLAF
jgi:uncharacterized protein (UPF0297 family)